VSWTHGDKKITQLQLATVLSYLSMASNYDCTRFSAILTDTNVTFTYCRKQQRLESKMC